MIFTVSCWRYLGVSIITPTSLLMKAAVTMDMYGCPNRCLHCWIRHDRNADTPVEEFIWLAELFKEYERDGKPFFDELVFNTWHREPDYPDNYRELWELENKLSTGKVPRFELASVWRLVREKDYAPWLKKLGVEVVQLTLFGTGENTDYFKGRKGAYSEHMQAIDVLLENGIVPRIQIFPFSTNVNDINKLYKVLKDIKLEERVNDIGKEFSCFLNTTTPMGGRIRPGRYQVQAKRYTETAGVPHRENTEAL